MNTLCARVRQWIPASPSGKAGLTILVVVLAVALLGPLAAPDQPDLTVGIPYAPPSRAHWLGLDFLGRDVLSRVLYGGLTVVFYAGIATIAAYTVGLLAGLLAGYTRTWFATVLMRSTDVLLSFPALVFLILLATAFGPGITGIVVATAIIQLPPIIRIVRSATLEQSVRGYVEAAVSRGREHTLGAAPGDPAEHRAAPVRRCRRAVQLVGPAHRERQLPRPGTATTCLRLGPDGLRKPGRYRHQPGRDARSRGPAGGPHAGDQPPR